MVLAIFAFSISNAQTDVKKSKNAKYAFEVNGNCDQCKKRIEKAAFGVGGVKMANWDIESHRFTTMINEEKTSIADVKAAIAKAGHDADDVRADDKDYENLHSCCLYDRKEVK